MKKKCEFLITLLFTMFMTSCQVGLGEIVDLEAPTIRIQKLNSKGQNLISNNGSAFNCAKKVTILGVAEDNVKVDSVYAEIKWGEENSFSYYADAKITDSGSFVLDLNFNREGPVTVKVTAKDSVGNIGSKSSRVVSLYVDETAPVGVSWYIDRKVPGIQIQYNLNSQEILKELDENLSENKDAFQNESFSINSSFQDAMGIKNEMTSIVLKEGNDKLVEVKSTASSSYAPMFNIESETAAKLPVSGKHFIDVYYNAEDIHGNKITDFYVGSFIWWPESDIPKIVPLLDSKENVKMNVKDTLSLSVFDDDSLVEGYFALVNENVYNSIKNNFKNSYNTNKTEFIDCFDFKKDGNSNNEREKTISLTLPSNPCELYLLAYTKDCKGKEKLINDFPITVVDDSNAMVFVASPKENSIPEVEMKNANKEAIFNIQGQVIDSTGCEEVKFAYVFSECSENKFDLAKAVLEGSTSDYVKVFNTNLDVPGQSEDGFYKQNFKLELDLLKDFKKDPLDDTKSEKYFVIQTKRKDGKISYKEYKLLPDNELPIITPITPSGDMQIVKNDEDFELSFNAHKNSKLAIESYKIEKKVDNGFEKLIDSNVYTITKEVLTKAATDSENLTYRFSATDIFGNTNFGQYTIIVSDIPYLNSITTSSKQKNKLGDEILINLNFSDTVNVTSGPKPTITLKGIKNGNVEMAVKAEYSVGSGTTTLTFNYKVHEGDESDNVYIDINDNWYSIPDKCISLASNSVDFTKIKNDAVLAGKTLQIDGIRPVVEDIVFKYFDVNKKEISDEYKDKNGNIWLKDGTRVQAVVTCDVPVVLSGKPTFNLNVDNNVNNSLIEMPLLSISDKELVFEYVIKQTDTNGKFSYMPKSAIEGCNLLTDSFGNSLKLSTGDKETLQAGIDTVGFKEIVIESNSTPTIGDKYKNYTFTVSSVESDSDTSLKNKKYSLDGGLTWKIYDSEVELTETNNYKIVARYEDYAGNTTDSSETEVNVNGTFPAVTLECTNPDGNYKTGETIKIVASFNDDVYLKDTANTYIKLNGKHIITKTGANSSNPIKKIEFEYTVQNNDDFDLSNVTLNLGNIVNDYNLSYSGPEISLSRPNVKCDGVIPYIISVTPGTFDSTNKVYDNIDKVTIKFNEPVKKNVGKIYLRQTAGWGIPSAIKNSDFDIILAELDNKTQRDILHQKNDDGTSVVDYCGKEKLELNEGNKGYYGEGTSIGPYKVSVMGLNKEKSPNITDVYYILDYRMGIFDTTEEYKIGITYNADYSKRITPNGKTTVNAIRNVLEKAGYHQRVLEVSSTDVTVNGSTITLKFPNGLTSDSDLSGRNWEILMTREAFMDEAGNYFADSQTVGNLVMKDNGNYASTLNNYSFRNSSLNSNTLVKDENLVLLKVGNSYNFNSAGVAKPVIRVDKYSYGHGFNQPKDDGTMEEINANVSNDDSQNTKPSAKVRYRIDCATKNSTIKYRMFEAKTNVSNSDYSTGGEEKPTVDETYTKTTRYWEVTFPSVVDNENWNDYTIDSHLLAGSGTLQGYKALVEVKASANGKENSSKEGIFQTVVAFSSNHNTCVSIRGRSSTHGLPDYQPFPLRDNSNGTPYLRRVYKSSGVYYWISYEILSISTFSPHFNTNWSMHWGWMYPGELTYCDDMKRWGD